ncbi:hypothetical protein Tco_0369568 [Tanacetum coccineum]
MYACFADSDVSKPARGRSRCILDSVLSLLLRREAKTTSPTTQAQVTCVSESVSYSKFDAKTFKVNEELRKGRWWEIVRRRPTAATKDHMISSYDVLIIQVDPHGFEGYIKMEVKVFKESHSRQDEEQAQDLKSMINTSIHKIEVYELMTKDKA